MPRKILMRSFGTGVAVTLAMLAASSSVAAESADKGNDLGPTVHVAQGPLR